MPSDGTLEGSGQLVPLRPIKVTFNETELSYSGFEEFSLDLDRFDQEQKFELWLSTNDGPSIVMLRNGEQAFLMYLRFNGDSGFVTKGDQDRQGTCANKLAMVKSTSCLSHGASISINATEQSRTSSSIMAPVTITLLGRKPNL